MTTAPGAAALALGVLVAVARRTELDLVSLDDDTPRLLGLRPATARLGLLVVGVLLSATAVAAAGTIGFVGLVAPHAARALVGRRHVRVVPVAVLLGAALVCTADLLGRTVIAPAQLGAGLMTAAIGLPYFLYLLIRTRRQRTHGPHPPCRARSRDPPISPVPVCSGTDRVSPVVRAHADQHLPEFRVGLGLVGGSSNWGAIPFR